MTLEQQRALARARARARVQQEARVAAGPQTTPEPNRAQATEALRMQAQRDFIRRATPFGFLSQPLNNIAADPERRASIGRAAQGFVRDVQQVPNLDLGRLARDTGQSVQQGVRDLPQTLGNIATHLPQVARSLTYGPFEDEENAQRRLDMARIQGDPDAQRAAAGEANAATAGAALNVAAPFAVARAPSVLRAGGIAAALDAPFALSRNSDQPLQERLPGALTEIGGAGAFGAGAQAAANVAPAITRMFPSRGAQMVQRMDRAGASVDAAGNPATPRGVTPSLATANRGVGVSGPATNMIGDNILAGPLVRSRSRRALTETRDAAHDIRGAYGRPESRDVAGRRIQAGLERYAGEGTGAAPAAGVNPRNMSTREMGFSTQAELVFDQALRPVQTNPAQLTATQRAFADLNARADSTLVRQLNTDPFVSKVRRTVEQLTRRGNNGAPPTLRDLREMRRIVREAQGRVRLGPDTVDNAALQRIEGALTEDMYAAAGAGAADLRAADRWYRRGRERINTVMRFMKPDDPAQSIQQLLRAGQRKTENVRLLSALRTALPDSEWRTVAASLIEEMGLPTDGAAGFVVQQGFSVERFATNYRALTPRARRILFGSRGGQGGRVGATMRQLADDLDNLAEVANAQKGVERGANFSGSGRDVNNFATGLTALSNVPTAAAMVGSLMLTGEMLTNPAFVRWLVSASRKSGGPAGIRRSLAQLRDLASRDPALWPAVAELEAQLQGQQYTPAPGAGGDPASMPSRTETAIQ